MTDDRTPGTGPETGEAPPTDKRRTARELYRELDGPVDEHFRRSLAGFSRRVGERVAQHTTADPQAAAQARRAALQEYDEARTRRMKVVAGGAGAVVVALSVASFIVFIAAPDPPSPSAVATADRTTTVVEVAAAKPVPDPGPPPPPSAPPPPPSLAPVAVPQAATAMPAVEKASFTPAAVTPSPVPAPLRRNEIQEVQKLLWSFGFKAGPIDGAVGPATHAAVVRYRQDRGLPPMGDVDRELLEQLRQDPAPKISPPAPPPPVAQPQRPAYAYNTASTASSNPFDAMRRDFIRFQQWLRSQ